jgi:hypothetical protein
MTAALGMLADASLSLAAVILAAAVVAMVVFTICDICGLARRRRDRQRSIGYGYGSVDGYRTGLAEGRAQGYARAQLDAVLATPAGSDDFTEALLSGALHEPVGEEFAALLDAVQAHERAARTGATS